MFVICDLLVADVAEFYLALLTDYLVMVACLHVDRAALRAGYTELYVNVWM